MFAQLITIFKIPELRRKIFITLAFLAICMATVWWIFKTGYRLKN